MKGAKAEPSVRMMSAPSNINKMMIGASHHFFLTLMKSQNSLRMDNLLTEDLFFKIVSHNVWDPFPCPAHSNSSFDSCPTFAR